MNSPRLSVILLVAVAGLHAISLSVSAETPPIPAYQQTQSPDPYPQPVPLQNRTVTAPPAKAITPRQASEGNAAAQPGKPSQKPRTSGTSWVMTLVALMLVLGVILLLGRLFKKSGAKFGGMVGDDVLEVLGKRYLDQRQMVYLVRCGHRILILGSTINGLQTLGVVDDPVEVDYLAGLCKSQSGDNSIAQTFRALFSRQMQDEPPATPAHGTPKPATVNFPGTHLPTAGSPNRGERRHA